MNLEDSMTFRETIYFGQYGILWLHDGYDDVNDAIGNEVAEKNEFVTYMAIIE